MGVIKEFKDFAMKGNLVEMAVAFVMGAAFNKIVTSFIDGMVMPIVGKITADVDFKSLKYVMSAEQKDAAGKIISAEASIKYGEFITIFIDFVLVAFIMFLVVKAINKAKKKQAAEPQAAPAPSAEQKLLGEIRDLLKNK